MTDEITRICRQFADISPIDISLHLRGGSKLSRDVRSEPVGDDKCGRSKCGTCADAEAKGGGCQRHSTGYQYVCEECASLGVQAIYYGETSKSLFCRQAQHDADISKLKPDNAMAKHCIVQHNRTIVKFSVSSAWTL